MLRIRLELCIIGDEDIPIQCIFDNRVPPAANLDAALLLQHRAHIALMRRHFRETQQYIDVGHSRSRCHQLRIVDAQLA